jgi:hypothetical protein
MAGKLSAAKAATHCRAACLLLSFSLSLPLRLPLPSGAAAVGCPAWPLRFSSSSRQQKDTTAPHTGRQGQTCGLDDAYAVSISARVRVGTGLSCVLAVEQIRLPVCAAGTPPPQQHTIRQQAEEKRTQEREGTQLKQGQGNSGCVPLQCRCSPVLPRYLTSDPLLVVLVPTRS